MYIEDLLEKKFSGFLFINKPENMTSYDCIRYLKKILPKDIKLGHAGTLDPFAKGLLIVAVGKESTKKLSKFINFNKEYIATAKLGVETDTLDFTGNIIKKINCNTSKLHLQLAVEKLKDNYIQVPPVYSAKKYNGENLYYLARNGKLNQDILNNIAEQKAKKVQIYNIEILSFNYPYFEIKAQVSSGTYIRSLVNDLAKLNSSFATTETLLRTKIGDYSILDSINLKDIKNLEDLKQNLKIIF